MTEVIAVRRLSWDGKPYREVGMSLGKPAEAPDCRGEFYCPIRVDGFQAIELCPSIRRVALSRHQL